MTTADTTSHGTAEDGIAYEDLPVEYDSGVAARIWKHCVPQDLKDRAAQLRHEAQALYDRTVPEGLRLKDEISRLERAIDTALGSRPHDHSARYENTDIYMAAGLIGSMSELFDQLYSADDVINYLEDCTDTAEISDRQREALAAAQARTAAEGLDATWARAGK